MFRMLVKGSRPIITLMFLWVCASVSCSKAAQPPAAPPAPTITQSTFEPVYRASKAVQGATRPGVTYAKLGELLQNFSTEIAIAKDHPMNDRDKELITLYDEALNAYQYSGVLWKWQIEHADADWAEGQIIVGGFIGRKRVKAVYPDVEVGLTKYGLVLEEGKVPYVGATYLALPKEAIQLVWQKADEVLKRATDMYYGREQQKSPTAPAT